MKQKISAHLVSVKGHVSARITPIDNQSQYAQTGAQIVRKNKYAIITLSSGYTSHTKQKKMSVPKPGPQASFPPVHTPNPNFKIIPAVAAIANKELRILRAHNRQARYPHFKRA